MLQFLSPGFVREETGGAADVERQRRKEERDVMNGGKRKNRTKKGRLGFEEALKEEDE